MIELLDQRHDFKHSGEPLLELLRGLGQVEFVRDREPSKNHQVLRQWEFVPFRMLAERNARTTTMPFEVVEGALESLENDLPVERTFKFLYLFSTYAPRDLS